MDNITVPGERSMHANSTKAIQKKKSRRHFALHSFKVLLVHMNPPQNYNKLMKQGNLNSDSISTCVPMASQVLVGVLTHVM